MPIVLIRSLRPPSPERIDQMLSDVVRQLAQGIGDEAASVWAYWQELGGVNMGGRASAFEGHAAVVTILARTGRARNIIAAGLTAAARAVGAALSLPVEDVWVHWQDVSPGQVFAGGRVLE